MVSSNICTTVRQNLTGLNVIEIQHVDGYLFSCALRAPSLRPSEASARISSRVICPCDFASNWVKRVDTEAEGYTKRTNHLIKAAGTASCRQYVAPSVFGIIRRNTKWPASVARQSAFSLGAKHTECLRTNRSTHGVGEGIEDENADSDSSSRSFTDWMASRLRFRLRQLLVLGVITAALPRAPSIEMKRRWQWQDK